MSGNHWTLCIKGLTALLSRFLISVRRIYFFDVDRIQLSKNRDDLECYLGRYQTPMMELSFQNS